MNRSDLIVFEYRKDPNTLVETGQFVVLHGAESAGTAYDPDLTQHDLLTDTATLDQMPLWRVTVSGAVINTPAQMFKLQHPGGAVDLLWTNPAPDSAFASQTVDVGRDLRQYSVIFVGFRRTPNDTEAHLQWVTLVNASPYTTRSELVTVILGNLYARFVMVYNNARGLYFNSTAYETINGTTSGTNFNLYCVPIVAYGLRGTVNL